MPAALIMSTSSVSEGCAGAIGAEAGSGMRAVADGAGVMLSAG